MERYTWRWFLVDAFGGLGGFCFGCFGDWWCFALTWTRIDDWRLCYTMTWRLDIWLGDVLSWISRTLFTCLALELTMTRMDDVTSSRWWLDRCICSGSDGFSLFFFASWVLHILRVGLLKPLLVWSKRTLARSSRRVGSLILVGAERSEKIEVFHIATSQIVSDGFYQYIIEFSILIWCLLFMWLIYYMMHQWLINVVYKNWL